MKFLRLPESSWLLLALVGVAGLYLRLEGIDRSLWLDEAWVANSVVENKWIDVFYYPRWLQTTPPLFLILTRLTEQTLGMANWVFRVWPFIFSAGACVFTFLLLRDFSPAGQRHLAMVGTAVVVLSPTLVNFASLAKQYSAEAGCAALLTWLALRLDKESSERTFLALWMTSLLSLGLGLGILFLLPGVGLMLLPRWRRFWAFSISCGVALSLLYFVFLQPNTADSLRDHWNHGKLFLSLSGKVAVWVRELVQLFGQPIGLGQEKWYLPAFVLLLSPSLGLSGERRRQVLLIGWFPLFLACLADYLRLYPLSTRMALVLLPSFALCLTASLMHVRELIGNWADRVSPLATWALVLGICGIAFANRNLYMGEEGPEDPDGAVTYLYSRYDAEDLVFVHASMEEPFRFYAKKLGWNAPKVLYGKTNWACCPRGLPFPRGLSDETSVREDWNRQIPPNYSGRLWLLFSNRQEHWHYVGFDERPVIKRMIEQRRCIARPTQQFLRVGLVLLSCEAQK